MKRLAVWLASVCLALCTTGCAPWTVRPIQEEQAENNSGARRFDAARYVDSIWSSRLLPAIRDSAVELRTLLAALEADAGAAEKFGKREGLGPFHFIVKGRGRALGVDTRSRTGLVSIDLLPDDGRPDACLQVGPVIRGSSLRDAVGFIRFGEFVNQLEFADVANELNARVVNLVLNRVNPASMPGKIVSFHGTFTLAQGSLPEIVAVRLDLEE